MEALKFFFVMPLLASLFLFFSFTKKTSVIPENESSLQQEELVIGTISWEGNTRYSDEYLNEIIGLKPGSAYQKEIVENLLTYNPEKTTISDLYMDHGYLYFNVTLKDTVINEVVKLTFEVYEGITATVDKIIIKGNETVETQKILEMMEIKKGDLFNRTKLVASQRNIAKSGYFDEGNVNIYPIPHDDDLKLVDFEFTVHEIKRD